MQVLLTFLFLFNLYHKHPYLVPWEYLAISNSWVIAYFSGPNLFLYVIIGFTFPNAHTGLFPLIHSRADPSNMKS